jgi:hypothetical protein
VLSFELVTPSGGLESSGPEGLNLMDGLIMLNSYKQYDYFLLPFQFHLKEKTRLVKTSFKDCAEVFNFA